MDYKGFQKIAAVGVLALAVFALPALAQQTTPPPPQEPPTTNPRATDVRDWHQIDNYMDHHPEVARQLKKNPSLINNPQFLQKHPHIQKYMQGHPHVAQTLKNHPRMAIRAYRTGERREGPKTEKPRGR